MFWDGKTIEDSLDEHGHYAVILGPTDSAWNPTSTSHTIPGPATVSYTRNPIDLGWDVSVGPFDPTMGETEPPAPLVAP